MKKISYFLIIAFAFLFFPLFSYADELPYSVNWVSGNYSGSYSCNLKCAFFRNSSWGSEYYLVVYNPLHLSINIKESYSWNDIEYNYNDVSSSSIYTDIYRTTFSLNSSYSVTPYFDNYSALYDYFTSPISSYDSSIFMGALYKISLYSSNTNDVVCWGDGNAESIQIKVYVNDVEKYQHMYNTSLIPSTYHFKHLDHSVVDGDVIKVVATPFTNNDYGASKEISWVARSSLIPSSFINISNSNLLSPSVTVNNISVPVGIENVDVKTITPNGSVVTTYYSNSYDVSNVSSSNINTVTNNIVNNYYNSSDTINNIVNNNSYSYSYNFGGGTVEEMTQTYNNGIGSIKGYSDDLISSISVFNGTPFQPLFITVSVGLGLIVALALIFVAIKVVGLIL